MMGRPREEEAKKPKEEKNDNLTKLVGKMIRGKPES